MAQRSPGLASPRLLGWTLQMAASVVRCRRAFWRLLGRRAVARHVLVMSSWVQRPHGHGSRHPGPRHAPSGQGPVALARCARPHRPHRPRACARRGHTHQRRERDRAGARPTNNYSAWPVYNKSYNEKRPRSSRSSPTRHRASRSPVRLRLPLAGCRYLMCIYCRLCSFFDPSDVWLSPACIRDPLL